ncbi:MAG: helix-turn-helix domain-containing protein [Rhodospirillaceae bacterium]|nr:helix-turn-helix domain-containing protein [Rhodospirillaceae bacterium]
MTRADPIEMRLVRQSFALGKWESVFRAPDPRLRGLVMGDYHGWIENSSTGMRQTEASKMLVPLVINLGPALDIDSPGNLSATLEPYDSFVAGLHDAMRWSGRLAARSARRWISPSPARGGCSESPCTRSQTVSSRSKILRVTTAALRSTGFELHRTGARFGILDDSLLTRLARAADAPHQVDRALGGIKATGGAIGIGMLARELDCSRKQLIRLFDDTVGLPPKILARIYWFERAVRRLDTASRPALSELALECGYYDQAHFNREFRAFVGCTPGEYRHLAAAG